MALNRRGNQAAARTAYATALGLEDPAWPVRLLALGAMTEGALAASERQALAATVCIAEWISPAVIPQPPCSSRVRGAQRSALGARRETRFQLMALTFSALLLAGEVQEARGIGAMAYLACFDGRFEVAARIAACADHSQAAHGHAGRRPAEQRLRTAVATELETARGSVWLAVPAETRSRLDELSVCSLALGLRA